MIKIKRSWQNQFLTLLFQWTMAPVCPHHFVNKSHNNKHGYYDQNQIRMRSKQKIQKINCSQCQMASIWHGNFPLVPWFPGWGCLRRVWAHDNNRPICIISSLVPVLRVLSFLPARTHSSGLIPRSGHVTMLRSCKDCGNQGWFYVKHALGALAILQ